MEELEQEVLEPITDWEKEIPVLADIVENEVVIQQIIINNEVQKVTGKAFALVCPKCGAIIQQFPAGALEADVHLGLCTDDEKILNTALHCRTCGQKIKIFRPSPIDGEFTVEDVKDNE